MNKFALIILIAFLMAASVFAGILYADTAFYKTATIQFAKSYGLVFPNSITTCNNIIQSSEHPNTSFKLTNCKASYSNTRFNVSINLSR